ncbi:MAG: PIG-L family deacetylase [Clostridia bacterium]|nr:PIG-L family deacetylase [Clostridia bacterium]
MKKTFILIFTVLAAFSLIISASAVEAKKLDAVFSVEAETKYTGSLAPLADNKYTSFVTLEPGSSLVIKADNTAWVYVKFHGNAPSSYCVQAEDNSVIKHSNGFLHDTVKIPVSNITKLYSDEPMQITEIEVYSDGTLQGNIQRWENTLSKCDILITSTHSDDDTLFFGALAAEQASYGRMVQTVFVCNHSNELHRLNELLDGQWTLGITAYPIFGEFEDYYSMSLAKAQEQFDVDAVSDFLVSAIRRTRPKVVITHDVNGEYGHGAHRLVSLLTRKAVEVSNDATYFPESAERFGTHEPQKTYIHLYKENQIVLDVKKKLDSLNGATPFSVAQKAYGCHKSQHKWDFAVTTSGTDDCTRFGLYKTTVECDLKSKDVLNGITPYIPSVSATSTAPSALSMRAKSKDTTPEHKPENKYEALAFFTHDSNGNITKAPKSSVVACFSILIFFSLFILITSLIKIHIQRKS